MTIRLLQTQLLCLAVGLCLYLLLANIGLPENNKFLKYMPFLLMVIAASLNVFHTRNHFGEVWRIFWPLVLLAGWVIIASLYARFVVNIDETALPMGLSMLVAPMTAVLVPSLSIGWLDHFRKVGLYLAFPAAFLIYLYGKLQGVQVLHEEVMYLLPLPLLFLQNTFVSVQKVVTILFLFMIIALLSHKNTAYLTALTATACLVYLRYRFVSLPKKAIILQNVVGIQTFLLGMLVFTFLWIDKEKYLPDGSAVYRLHTYELAWSKFLESPLFGDYFTGSFVLLFDLYEIGGAYQYLPTHSDLLDVLSHGGIVGMGLLLVGIFYICRCGFQLLNGYTKSTNFLGVFSYFNVVLFSGFVAMAFNPTTLNPLRAFFVWFSAGCLGGLYIYFEQDRSATEEGQQ